MKIGQMKNKVCADMRTAIKCYNHHVCYSEQNDELKKLLNDLDLSKLDELESQRSGGDGAVVEAQGVMSGTGAGATIQLGNVHKTFKFTGWYGAQGAVSIRKTVLPGMVIPMLKIRRPNGRLIFNMEIAIRR